MQDIFVSATRTPALLARLHASVHGFTHIITHSAPGFPVGIVLNAVENGSHDAAPSSTRQPRGVFGNTTGRMAKRP